MNLLHHSRKFRPAIYLFFALLSFSCLVVLPLIRQYENTGASIREKVSLYFYKKEQRLLEQTERLVAHLQPGLPNEIPWFSGEGSIPDDIMVLMYRHDTLRFWSDNGIPYYDLPTLNDTALISIRCLPNGWYLMHNRRVEDLDLKVFILIKHEYPIQNQYLRNEFPPGSGIPPGVQLSLSPTDDNLYSANGHFLVGITSDTTLHESVKWDWLVVCNALTYLFLLLFLCDRHSFLPAGMVNTRWRVAMIVAGIWLLRGMQYLFQWPAFLYNTWMFERVSSSVCWLYPSTGDFLMNGFLALVLAGIYFTHWPASSSHAPDNSWRKIFMILVRITVSFILLTALMSGMHTMITMGLFTLDLQQISRFSAESIPALFGLVFWLLAWVFIVLRLSGTPSQKPSFSHFFLALVLVSLVATVTMHYAHRTAETEHRKNIARKLIHRENPVTEQTLFTIADTMKKDTVLLSLLNKAAESTTPRQVEDSASRYILETYFHEGWHNFIVQATICTKGKELSVQPQGYLIGCNQYFENTISSYGKPAMLPGVVFLDYGYGNEDYLLHLEDQAKKWSVFLEISSLTIIKGTGYPELLVDRSSYDFPEIADYAFAFYENGRLVHRMGSYAYGYDLNALVDTASLEVLTIDDAMNHMVFSVNDHMVLLISLPQPSWLSTLSSFSYLLIFMLILSLLGYTITHIRSVFSFSWRSLRNRLQLTMLGLILVSFVILGIVMMVYLVSLNSQKNKENLLERTLSILIEVEHKFNYLDNLNQVSEESLEAVLVKFSNVFFSDINLYEPSGHLLASSRPRIFEVGLISDRIHPEALMKLQQQNTGMFVLTESIGRLSYLSAYIPFYNSNKQLLGYLNLPYFSKQDDLRREISSFLVAFINIYVVLMILGVLLTYLISNYITSPLKLLASHLGAIRMGRTSDKLTWKQQDEIGRLVEEYNRMVDELAISAKKLAISERETAWREMAQQVAHEIKNPLTPMKLSVQHLLHTWQDNPADWTDRLQRFSDALVAQIDTLSRIASEFSFFAKMPEPENETLDLDELVKKAMAIYTDVSSIVFTVETTPEKKWIYADRNQMLRVLSNVLNNAVQALEEQPGGRVSVKLSAGGLTHSIAISDNGKGISSAESDRIFQPRFTTKSGGTGLGLAIVQGIIQSIGGKISFTSQPGSETTFLITLPAVYADTSTS